jgi:hypothetical protein
MRFCGWVPEWEPLIKYKFPTGAPHGRGRVLFHDILYKWTPPTFGNLLRALRRATEKE